MRPFISEQQFPNRSDGEIAAMIGRRLIEIELRGSGDIISTMYRLQNTTGIPFWTWKGWWNWQNRVQPKTVLSSTWSRLMDAYQIAIVTALNLLKTELVSAKKLANQKGAKVYGGDTNADKVGREEESHTHANVG